MSIEIDHEGVRVRVLDHDGQKILATEIREGKSLEEIAEKLEVDIEIVKRTAETVVRVFAAHGRTSATVERLQQALFDCDYDEDWYGEEKSK